MKIIVHIIGCDDETTFIQDVENVKDFITLCELSVKTSNYGCMPTIKIYEYDEMIETDLVKEENNYYFSGDYMKYKEITK